ncbi:hypothetical protein ABFX02_09G092800 [Erythranthe guttata]
MAHFKENPFVQSRIRTRPNFDFNKPRIPLSVNRSKLNIPYKSEICSLFQRGKCYYGDNCHFSHTTTVIRNLGFQSVAAAAVEEHLNNEEEDDSRRNSVYESKVCRWFSGGAVCPFGDRCSFLHVIEERVHSDHEIRCWNFNYGVNCDKSVWKTKLCMKWLRFGDCPFGLKCSYAHGREELQEAGAYAKMESRCTRFAGKRQNAASLSEVGKKIAKKMQLKGKRCLMEWKFKNTNRIYADWIDDTHNFDVSFSKVES